MRFKALTIILGAVLGLIAVFLKDPTVFQVCYEYYTANGSFCSAPYGYPYGVTLLPFALGLCVASVLAFFASQISFRRWIRFTLWFGAVAIVLMLLAAASEIDIGFLTVSLFDLEKVAQGLAGIYVVSSILLLAVSEMLIRRKG